MAVTATASDRVRDDVCQILHMDQYQFFRSTFQRPNLTYTVIPKGSLSSSTSNDKHTIHDMAHFIQTYYPTSPGIVYTYSKKDANTVADAFCELGIIAEVRNYCILSIILFSPYLYLLF